MEKNKQAVKHFWDEASCGEELYLKGENEVSQFQNERKTRYELEPEIVDFADLDEVQGNRQLSKAGEIANGLESSLSSLLTVGAEYVKTRTLVRADTIGNEVKLVVGQIEDKTNLIKTQS